MLGLSTCLEGDVPHITDRFVHDADTHTMETRDWLEPFCEERYKKQVASIFNRSFEKQGEKYLETISLHDQPEFRAKDEEESRDGAGTRDWGTHHIHGLTRCVRVPFYLLTTSSARRN